ncbi:MAG: hypothetical protein L3J51_00855 [Cocleimonas sp.]|nr:hypothetical protein [Cocleimonas sp.]
MNVFHKTIILLFVALFWISFGQSSPNNEIVVSVESQKNIKEIQHVLSDRLNKRYGGFFSKVKSQINDNKTITFTFNNESDVSDDELPYYIETQGQFRAYINEADPWLTNADIIDAKPSFDETNRPSLRLTLSNDAAKRMKKNTHSASGKILVIELDKNILAKVKISGTVGKYIEIVFTDSVFINYRTAALLNFKELPEKVTILNK